MVVLGRPLRVLIMTWYVAARVLGCNISKPISRRKEKEKIAHLKPVMPMRPGTWPTAMLMAEPVMKPLTAGAGMNSTSQPIRRRPTPRTMQPVKKANNVAISGPDHSFGWCASTCWIICATVTDITATGPMDTSLDVAKNLKAVRTKKGQRTLGLRNRRAHQWRTSKVHTEQVEWQAAQTVKEKTDGGTDEKSYLCIGHSLRDDYYTNSQASDNVATKPTNVWHDN